MAREDQLQGGLDRNAAYWQLQCKELDRICNALRAELCQAESDLKGNELSRASYQRLAEKNWERIKVLSNLLGISPHEELRPGEKVLLASRMFSNPVPAPEPPHVHRFELVIEERTRVDLAGTTHRVVESLGCGCGHVVATYR